MVDDIKLVDKQVVNDLLSKGNYLARAIIEIVGKPQKHVEDTLHDYLKKISEDYKLLSISSEETKPVEDSKELFSSFAEIEFLAKDLDGLLNFTIDYMPASIEVVEPSKLNVSAPFVSQMLTEFVGKVHTVDMELKKSRQETIHVSQSLNVMILNSIIILLHQGPRDKQTIAKIVGIVDTQIDVFLDRLIKENKIVKDGEVYAIGDNPES